MGAVLTNLGGIICCTEDQFGCTVVSRADIGYVGLIFDENLGASKVAQLQNATGRVKKEILWLDVSVTYALGMDVGEGAEKLVDVKLHLERRHDRL